MLKPVATLITGVCSTCLATDRELFPLQRTPQFVNICVGITLSQSDIICYECRARLHNFIKFRSLALRAKTLLSQAVDPGFRCLSTLTRTAISPHNTIYVHSDSVKREDAEYQGLKVLDFKAEGGSAEEDSDSKPVLDAEKSVNFDAASECAETKPLKEKTDFLVRQIDRREVLAYLERERGSERYKRAPYKCDKCALPFMSEQKLKSHNTLHSEKRGSLKCEVCEQRHKDSSTLKLHTDSHYRSYACRQCDRSDCSYYKMCEHYKNCHLNKLQLCRKCPARFMSKRELKNHARTAHKRRRRLPCEVCARQFATRDSLQRHSRMQHTEVPELECDICHKKYRGRTYLSVHVRNVHGARRGPREDSYCAECDLQFKDPQQFRQHLKTTRRHVPVEDHKYECDYCGKRFVAKYNVRTHIKLLHLKLPAYKCDVCAECFPTSSYLTVHKRGKHGVNPRARSHACRLCEKAFTMRKSLEDHMNTHLGIRPYECRLCGATFAYKAALFNHNRLVHKTDRGQPDS